MSLPELLRGMANGIRRGWGDETGLLREAASRIELLEAEKQSLIRNFELEAAEHKRTEERVETLQAENESQQWQLRNQCFAGNSIGYIYDKMHCYKDQVGTMGEIMQTLGHSYSDFGRDNNERRFNGLRWAERIAERLDMEQEIVGALMEIRAITMLSPENGGQNIERIANVACLAAERFEQLWHWSEAAGGDNERGSRTRFDSCCSARHTPDGRERHGGNDE